MKCPSVVAFVTRRDGRPTFQGRSYIKQSDDALWFGFVTVRSRQNAAFPCSVAHMAN